MNVKTITAAAAMLSAVAIAIKQNDNDMPSIKGALEVRSNIPGRMRLYSPKIKSFDETMARLEQLHTNRVVTSVAVNPVTQTILLTYDKAEIEPEILAGVVLKLLEADKKESSKVGLAIKSITDGVDYLLQDKSNGLINLTQAVAGTFIGMGMKQCSAGKFSVPNAATLFWWAYSMLRKSGSNV